ncbi:MAG: adenylate/guanylate cyclase domain-containing protein, partial [Deltaproteobacteria bacterium]|nr:adenylate/guanylate cyclase domain-containing protein [Deltaproteobacteria bacterium]
RVYLVTALGQVVGHPSGLVTEQASDGSLQIAHAYTHPDPMLQKAWTELVKRGVDSRDFATGDLLVIAEEFPKESGIDWIALGVAPKDDYFGEARKQAMFAVLVGLVVMIFAAGMGAMLASRVAYGMKQIGEEMDRVGRFELSEGKLQTGKRWAVREVTSMAEATDRMKSGLRSFARYVPTQLVKDLLESGEEAKLGGHKQELTIYFSDLEGFTTLSEQMDPDELVTALGDYLSAMSEVVRANTGTVDKFIGDAIMAFWGAPRPFEDHAYSACISALRMSAKLEQMQVQWRSQGRPEFRARMGINSGTVVVGNIGSPERMNYTVVGDAVNLASRLEGLNKSYGTQILLGEATANALQGRLILRPVDWVAVKGRAQAVLVYELVGERGKVDDGRINSIQLHRDGLELYKKRMFTDAADKFDQVSVARGQPDEAAKVLAERCRRYVKSPPPADWSGANVMHEK